MSKVHLINDSGFGHDCVYACNWACSSDPDKATKNKGKVTCDNCNKIIDKLFTRVFVRSHLRKQGSAYQTVKGHVVFKHKPRGEY